MIQLSYLFEKYPDNPNTIIISNEFYKSGLKESDVYNYYINNKNIILNNINNRHIMLFIFTKLNEYIVKRKIKNSFITLNSNNYETVINGRTASIHSSMNNNENFGIIDIDGDNFDDLKKATIDVYNYIVKKFKKVDIRYTGKTSFHIIPYFDKSNDINYNKIFLKDLLIKEFSNSFTTESKRQKNKINLDLSSNKLNGGFITENCLSIMGLRCMKLNINNIKNFNKYDAMII